MSERPPKGWYQRHGLPHFDAPGLVQAITFRLADSFPAEAIAKIKEAPQHKRSNRVEDVLDAGFGRCILRHPTAATIVTNTLRHFDGLRYHLHEWVIMPNHVHVLARPFYGVRLPDVVHSWKSFTAQKINAEFCLQGPLWQESYFDRFIRDEKHQALVAAYIENNPVKAGLVNAPEEWPYGSAAMRRGEETESGGS